MFPLQTHEVTQQADKEEPPRQPPEPETRPCRGDSEDGGGEDAVDAHVVLAGETGEDVREVLCHADCAGDGEGGGPDGNEHAWPEGSGGIFCVMSR